MLKNLGFMQQIRRHTSTEAGAACMRKKRHQWLPAEDAQLLSIAKKHKHPWKTAKQQMDLGIRHMNYRRRYEVLTGQNHGIWTLAEVRKLQSTINELKHDGHREGSYGWWVLVAERLGTGRTPRACNMRWNNAVKLLRGTKQSPVILLGKRINEWSDSEKARLRDAIRAITETQDDSTQAVAEREPWLVFSVDVPWTLPMGFWMRVADMVGTRTAQQCRTAWEAQRNAWPRMSVGEIRTMMAAVREHGRRWEFIRAHYLPHVSAAKMRALDLQWHALQRTCKHDLLSLDPDEVLVGYTGGKSALRRTGTDGLYDPHGSLQRIAVSNRMSDMMPFRLAFHDVNSKPRRNRPRVNANWIIEASRREKLPFALMHSVELYEKVLRAENRHKGDWAAVGKELSLAPAACYNLARRISELLPTVSF
ncbi:hypothetical protein EC988_001432, partial [Linderina pennispora]